MKFKSIQIALILLFTTKLAIVSAILAGGNPSGVAAPTDAYAGATNPAGIMYVGDRYDAGFRWHNDFKNQITKNNSVPTANGSYDATYQRKNFIIPDVAINKSFKTQLGCKTWEWALNFVSYCPFYNRSSWKKPYALAGTTPLDYLLWDRVISGIIAVKLSDEHAIGISVDFHKLRTRVGGVQNFESPFLTVAPTLVTNNGYANTYGATATLGWRWQVTKTFALGLTYTPQFAFDRIHKYKGFFPQHGLVNLPNDLRFGVLYVFTPKFAAILDIRWLNFSKTINGNRLANALGQFNVLGSKHGAAEGFKDRFILTLGAQYAVSDALTIRGSYLRLTPVVPRSQTFYNGIVGILVSDIITAGATYKFWKTNEFSFYFAHGFETKLRGRNSIPPVQGGGEANLKERFNLIGLSLGHNY